MAEGYQVIARRWRPQQFDELVGQEHIVRTLKNAITQDRIAHAYLFVGPRGTGKTTTARIFAKALNAEGGPNPNPDDSTPISQSIMNGSCMDVIEIDGASNNGVDDIRDLREECQYTPTEGSFKVYIIDEVHMLSNNAWNALLKTLEEPPAHVKFIFATTEAHKVLPTVVSRCQRFEFRPIPDEKIVGKLGSIAEAENIKVAPAALQSVARLADGGMRDAQSILDQLISFCGNDISEENVLEVYGLASEDNIQSMASFMAKGDYGQLIGLVEELVENGRDLYRVLLDLQSYVRSALLDAIKQNGKTDMLGVLLSAESLMRMVDALHSGEYAIRQGLSQRVNFEVTLLKAVEQSRTRAIDSVIKELTQVAAGLPQEAGQKKIEVSTSPKSDVEESLDHVANTEDAVAPLPEKKDESNTPDFEWNISAQAAEEFKEENGKPSEALPTSTEGDSEKTIYGPENPLFGEALKKIPPETAQMLDQLLRANFKFVQKIDPKHLLKKK